MGGSARGLAVDGGDARASRGVRQARDAAILAQAPLAEAIRQIDADALEALRVVDTDGRKIGAVSDLDIRRALLRGAGLDAAIGSLLPLPTEVNAGAPETAALERS